MPVRFVIRKLIERYAGDVELNDIDEIWKERYRLVFEIQDRHAAGRPFSGGHQFAAEPQAAAAVRAEMQVYRKCLLRGYRVGQVREAIGCVKPGDS
jgi:hypothetical protein